jgi:nucleoside-diphosphate-sugar epimerase
MNVLVTGHLGYIGVQLVDVLQEAGHIVTGCDLGLFRGCDWERFARPQDEFLVDVGELTEDDLRPFDAVCHLAAISNDPMGDLDESITYAINRDRSYELARRAKAAGVPRFLFAGSCSIYGAGKKHDLEEVDALNPLTAYARSKVEAEQLIGELADGSFCPTFLRNATAYGHSPMLRIDLVVNNLLASALSYGEIRIMSDGSPWRPLIHCRDIARAFRAMLEAPEANVHNQSINVGDDCENYQVRDVGNLVEQLVPAAKVVYTGEVGADPRNYRVSFAKLHQLLPDFSLQYTLADGMRELHAKMVEHGFDRDDFEGPQFVRMRTLQERMHLVASEPVVS